MCGGNGKEITPDEEQRTQIIELVKNMNLTAKKFPRTNGWSYRITYYKDGIANNIVLAGRVEWNGAEYKTDEDSYNRLIEYIDILYKELDNQTNMYYNLKIKIIGGSNWITRY